jgi:acetylornithine/succinyldiaminopimelate/putrescine aminotransferase
MPLPCQAEARLREGLAGSVVRELRGAGLLLGLDAGGEAQSLKAWLQDHGILVGASNDPRVLRLMPPLNISDRALDELIERIHAFSALEAACNT